jgi:hypothetical protein
MWTRTDGCAATIGMIDYTRTELGEAQSVEGNTLFDSMKYCDFKEEKGDG